VTLRPLRSDDLGPWLAYGRDPEFVRLVGGDPRSINALTAEDVTQQYLVVDQSDCGWAIEAARRFVGTARFHSWDVQNSRARFAIGILDRSLWNRGIGSEATMLALSHAFRPGGLHRVDLRVLEENGRAIRCYEKCGFVIEGREREGARIAGEWKTDVLMSVLEHEWRDRTQAHP
jgi:[ribosomal protein S5]-alanine N-acetyltransferase